MQTPLTVDFARLLGFETIEREFLGAVDFKDLAVDARLGAKVGAESMVALDLPSPPQVQRAKV